MNYTVRLKRSAEKELEDLPNHVHDRIAERLLALEQNPRPRGVRKLRGRQRNTAYGWETIASFTLWTTPRKW